LKMTLCFEIFISGVKFPFPLWSDSGESHSEALAETSHRTCRKISPPSILIFDTAHYRGITLVLISAQLSITYSLRPCVHDTQDETQPCACFTPGTT